MSIDTNWDIDKHKEDHECDEHWELRKAFMERWKNDYPEERLVCLARVFANMEFMGCRYPSEVMHEVARLSKEVAQNYRNIKKTKLQRTFVSASDAAEDRARGIKREGGVVKDATASKSSKIQFVKPGQSTDNEVVSRPEEVAVHSIKEQKDTKISSEIIDANDYLNEMLKIQCINVRSFDETMFYSNFGRMVLLIRPWAGKWWNIQTSCQNCGAAFTSTFENGMLSMYINNNLVAQATGSSKVEAKSIVESMAWNRLRQEVISVVMKEQWIAQGFKISVNDVGKRKQEDEFGTPVENSVATKMMKLMGWKGGGLGAEAQGIAEPIKPHLQMVNRQGLGSTVSDVQAMRRSAQALMRRYLASDTLDVDLVFSSEFTKDERAQLHQMAQRMGLASRSYGADADRFLVVKKKLDPFSLIRAVIEKGGNTPKYQVFIPSGVNRHNGR